MAEKDAGLREEIRQLAGEIAKQRVVAKKDVVVTDAAGVQRKVIAGYPVPLDLIEAYERSLGSSKPKRAAAKRKKS